MSLLSTVVFASAQTYTACNPLHSSCDPDPALGRAVTMNFADGPSPTMTRTGSATIVYDPYDGALFSIAGSGHNPTLQSKFYIMFGKVIVNARAAPGSGIVSSIVLQSDALDEIDIEFVGNDPHQFQTNYFSRGDTSTYDRGSYHQVSGSVTGEYHTYTIEWTSKSLKWSIDDQLVRTLNSVEKPDIYPQTPMSVRVGSWAAGDPSNLQGTIDWAGGLINYAEGPFVYSVKTLSIEDYSTGVTYEYTDQSGTWQSIHANGGQIGADGPVSREWLQHLVDISKPI